MKRRRSTRSPGCSRTSSRRISARPLGLLLAAPLLILPLHRALGEQDLRIGLEGGRVMVSLRYDDARAPEVLAALEEGLASEIQFQLRLYRRQRWPFAFLGDRLVNELRIVRTARYDRFEKRYLILSQGTAEERYAEPRGFLEAFFSLGPLELGELEAGALSEQYVQTRVRLVPVKIVYPLKLITLFFPQGPSPWLRKGLPQ